MDPAELIVAALTAGATSAATSTGTDVAKDTYKRLKTLLIGRLGKKAGSAAVDAVELDPEGDHTALADTLRVSGADQDNEIQKVAAHL